MGNPQAIKKVLGDYDFALPKSAPEGRFLGREESWGRTRQDSLLGDNYSVSTEMVHEVGGDSAKVKGQDVPVIVGVGSLLGKALIAGRTGRVVATRVGMGLYRLFLITVFVQGVLPLWPKRAKSEAWTRGPFSPYPLLPCLPHAEVRDPQPQVPKGKGKEPEGKEAAVDACGWAGAG